MKGRNGSTSFLPLKKKCGLNDKVMSEACLTKDQAKQVYDKIESGDELKIGRLFHSRVIQNCQNRGKKGRMLMSMKRF